MRERLLSGWCIRTNRSPALRSSSICTTMDTSFLRCTIREHALVKLGQARDHSRSGGLRRRGRAGVSRAHRQLVPDFWSHARCAPTTHELDDAMQAVLSGSKPRWQRRARWAATSRTSNDQFVPETGRIRAGGGSRGLHRRIARDCRAHPPSERGRRPAELDTWKQRSPGHLQSRHRSHRLSLLRIVSSAG